MWVVGFLAMGLVVGPAVKFYGGVECVDVEALGGYYLGSWHYIFGKYFMFGVLIFRLH